MKQADWVTLLRTLLIAFGSWLYGHNIAGTNLTPEVWAEWVGAALALGMAIQGAITKVSGWEAIESALRSVMVIVGGLLKGLNLITDDKWNEIMLALPAVLAFIWSYVAKRKTAKIISGDINPKTDLVQPHMNPIKLKRA